MSIVAEYNGKVDLVHKKTPGIGEIIFIIDERLSGLSLGTSAFVIKLPEFYNRF
jgi:hypothetical protein